MENRLINRSFGVRTLSGAVLAAVVVGAIMLSPFSMLMLLALLSLGSMLEFYRIARRTGAEPLDTYPTTVGVLLVIMTFFYKAGKIPGSLFWCFIPALFLLFVIELYRKKENPFANIAWALTGIVYIAVPFALLAYIPVQAATHGYLVYHPMLLLSVILMVWVNDVGAYLFGVTLGRHRLFERISPKKSWEGFFGGVIFTVGTGVLLAYWLDAPLAYWGGAGLVIAVAGVLGDLVESMLKRSVELKDSGNLIPGHGGLLDRFDALILATPFVFIYFIIFAA